MGPQKKVGRVETGVVFEQAVEMEDEQGRRMRLRRIELQLEEPTEEGDTCIRLLTNVPLKRMGASFESGASRTDRCARRCQRSSAVRCAGLYAPSLLASASVRASRLSVFTCRLRVASMGEKLGSATTTS